MGRPYKGKRLPISSKLPEDYWNKLARYCELTGWSKLEYIAHVMMTDLDNLDLDALEGQEKLPISA